MLQAEEGAAGAAPSRSGTLLLHGGSVSSRSWSSAILPASLSGLSWFSADKRGADESGAVALSSDGRRTQQEDTHAGLPGEAAEQGGPVGAGDKKNGTSFQVRANAPPSPNATLEATQKQILSPSPTDATRFWWHLYGS